MIYVRDIGKIYGRFGTYITAKITQENLSRYLAPEIKFFYGRGEVFYSSHSNKG